MLRWETNSKFYEIYLSEQKGIGWLVFRKWGSLFTKRGNFKMELFKNFSEVEKLIDRVGQIRKNHNYIMKTCKI